MSKIQLGVIYGSRSCEHEVSIISAVQLMKNADTEKYDVIPIYVSQKGEWFTGDALFERIKGRIGFQCYPIELSTMAGMYISLESIALSQLWL